LYFKALNYTEPVLSLRKSLCFLLGLSLFSAGLYAQKIPLRVAYQGPFFVNYGGSVGTSFTLEDPFDWQTLELRLNPSIGYYEQNTQRNLLLKLEAAYRYVREGKKWHPQFGLSFNYILASQEVGGSVNLGTGEIEYERLILNQISPAVHLGYDFQAAANRQFYFQVFYGPLWDLAKTNSAFFGLELGMVYHFNQEE